MARINFRNTPLESSDECVRLESDIVYHSRDNNDGYPVTYRTEYDLISEMQLFQDQKLFLENKIDMIPGVLEAYVGLRTLNENTLRTEDDITNHMDSFRKQSNEMVDLLTKCYEGTGIRFENDLFGEAGSAEGIRFEDDMGYIRMEDSMIGRFFSTIWKWIKGFFKWVWNGIKKIFSGIMNLFSDTSKILERLKKQIEDLSMDLNEDITSFGTELSYFLHVLKSKDRQEFPANCREAVNAGNSNLADWVKAMEDAVTGVLEKYRSNPSVLANQMKAINDNKFSPQYLNKNRQTSDMTKKMFYGGDPKEITFTKAVKKGGYYNIGYQAKSAACLFTHCGVECEVITFAVIEKTSEIKSLRPEELKEELTSVCDMGIAFCEEFTKKARSDIEKSLEESDTHLKNMIKGIEGSVYDLFKEFDGGQTKGAIEKELKGIVQAATQAVSNSTKGILSAINTLGHQPQLMVKAVRSGMKRFK